MARRDHRVELVVVVVVDAVVVVEADSADHRGLGGLLRLLRPRVRVSFHGLLAGVALRLVIVSWLFGPVAEEALLGRLGFEVLHGLDVDFVQV